MNKLFSAVFFIFILTFTPPLWAVSASEIAGTYELSGVMEMAGGLKLMSNQKYEAQFSYGAADWAEGGTWKLDKDNSVVLSDSKFIAKNTANLSLFLPSGTRFTYTQGKLTATGPNGSHLTFINPNKTPSTQSEPGEGRMRVKGTVVKMDSEILQVKIKERECVDFDVNKVSPDILDKAKKSKHIDVEIPYSSIIGGESC